MLAIHNLHQILELGLVRRILLATRLLGLRQLGGAHRDPDCHEYDLGALTGVSSSCAFFSASASPLLEADVPADAKSRRGWRALPPPPSARQRQPLALLAIDVEMIERKVDGLRLPVKVGLVRAALHDEGEGETILETILDSLVDPSALDVSWADPADAAKWDFKEHITGLAASELRAAAGTSASVPLSAVQASVAAALDAGAFLVGHNIASDLRALHLHGHGLRRRLIDTEALYPFEGQRRAPLRALVARLLLDDGSGGGGGGGSSGGGGSGGGARWAHFQDEGKVHAPLEDAEAALQLVLRELRLLRSQPGRALCEWDASRPPKPPAAVSVFCQDFQHQRVRCSNKDWSA
mmetsp:Transcript_41264/g.113513  ORF Transcript_41264/g.113513 Transcript_41264/m.113513 type:complete len:352 (+) Transcript_41264:56-1111(+)